MGVHGLWELLAPVGRRVSVETLAGKKLAIDASIWMIQFMKAMRDEKGDMVRNAHILGFFRRICKLLFLRTKPVFVFDGGTPALKRRTVIARRRQRENAQAKVRKTAEKLLLNHLKAMRLKELAEEIKSQRPKSKGKVEKGSSIQNENLGYNLDKNDVTTRSNSQEKLDAKLAASIGSEEGGSSTNNPSTSATLILSEEEDGEEMMLPALHGKVDHTVLAALPQSMQHVLRAQLGDVEMKEPAKDRENRTDDKGKKIMLDHADMLGSDNSQKDDVVSRIYNQEKLDEMLAASIAAEEDLGLTRNASKSAASVYPEDYIDEDEEMILPAMHGKVDPAVLAALPPSMQLDLLGQMRERLMAENRQKYQKVKKAPAKFSELQIEAYLKTVAFRREIDEVQKSAAGRGVGGVQTSRIASEANREFIFSSSYTGDKQVLASVGVEKGLGKQQMAMEHPSTNVLNNVASTSKSDTPKGSTQDNFGGVAAPVGVEKTGDEQQQAPREHPSTNFEQNGASTSKTVTGSAPDNSRRNFDDVETYLDDRGHLRVSRVRAMGIRMTRDLQRNLDLMKEVEHERNAIKIMNPESLPDSNENDIPKSLPSEHKLLETSNAGNGESVSLNRRNEQSMFKGETAIEICFKDDDMTKCFDGDDEMFSRLVAGDLMSISSAENLSPAKQSSESASECDWEEGHVGGESNSFTCDAKAEAKPFLREGNVSDDSEVDWEEDVCDIPKNGSPCFQESGKPVSRGSLEEDAALQEAIRRSVDDLKHKKPKDVLLESENLEDSEKEVNEGAGYPHINNLVQSCTFRGNIIKQTGSLCDRVDEPENSDGIGELNVSVSIDSPERQSNSSLAHDADKMETLIIQQCRKTGSPSETIQDTNRRGNLVNIERPFSESATPMETNETHPTLEKLLDTVNEDSGLSFLSNRCLRDDPHTPDAVFGGVPNFTQVDIKSTDVGVEPSHHSKSANPTSPLLDSSTQVSMNDTDVGQSLSGETNEKYFNKAEPNEDKFSMKDDAKVQFEVTEATLEEEMLVLAQERISLGDEQRRLERNAESVSSEMFTECQELLQMFGLPYIIAPMEAEAQCAYMELANLVDGVVTDDSDVFLFGARSVYKNIFDDRKYVETYFMKDIEKELGLTREKLMRMALLLGSDYTEGISGIGIVNAIEVLNAYPEEDGLHKFREWVESPDPTILGKFDTQTGSGLRKRGPKVSEKGAKQDVSGACELGQPLNDIEEEKRIFMNKHRNVSKNWYIPSSFPSEAVISAYASPQVDKSTEPFSWGKPDLSVLRKLCWEKFGWGSQKADDLLLPVLKEYNKHETQLRLEAFYTFNERFAKIRSKRINKAVKGITGDQSSALTDDVIQEASESRKKRRVSPKKHGDKEPEKLPRETEETVAESERKHLKRRKKDENISEVRNPESPMLAERKLSTRKEPKGVGRGRGRGRGRGAGRGRRKGSPVLELSETSSSDFNAGDELEMHVDKLECSKEVRRSGRSRKPVSYIVNDADDENMGKLSDFSNKKSSNKVVAGESSLSEGARGDAAHSDEKEQHNVGDPSHQEEPCRDYPEMRGGFCMDEGEVGDPGVSPNDGPSFQGELSRDYLKMGGGFCMDEDETNEVQDAANIPDIITVGENADHSHCSGIIDAINQDVPLMRSLSSPKRVIHVHQDGSRLDAVDTDYNLDHQTPSNKDDSSNEGVLQENAKDDTGTISAGVLRAMPSLRRKRRKG